VLASVPFIATSREIRKQRMLAVTISILAVVSLAGAGYVAWTMKLWKTLS
jgi:hypothetical protein